MTVPCPGTAPLLSTICLLVPFLTGRNVVMAEDITGFLPDNKHLEKKWVDWSGRIISDKVVTVLTRELLYINSGIKESTPAA